MSAKYSIAIILTMLVGSVWIAFGQTNITRTTHSSTKPADQQIAEASKTTLMNKEKSPDQNDTPLQQLRAQLQEKSRIVAEQSQEIQRLLTLLEGDALTAEVFCDHDDMEQSFAEELEDKRLMNQRHIEDLEQTLVGEGVDQAWNNTITARVQELLQQEGTEQSIPVEIDCRKNVCRIELEHPNNSAMELFSTTVTQLLDMSPESYTDLIEYPDERTATVVYLTRETKES